MTIFRTRVGEIILFNFKQRTNDVRKRIGFRPIYDESSVCNDMPLDWIRFKRLPRFT